MLSDRQIVTLKDLLKKEAKRAQHAPWTIEEYAEYGTQLALIEIELDAMQEQNRKAVEGLKKAHKGGQ